MADIRSHRIMAERNEINFTKRQNLLYQNCCFRSISTIYIMRIKLWSKFKVKQQKGESDMAAYNQSNKEKNTLCLYPEEVGVSVRQTKTFCMNSYLHPALAEDGQNPYRIYDQRFSRFRVTVIDTTNGKKYAEANIPVNMIADIIARSEYAFKRAMDVEVEPEVSGTSPAHTVRFTSGYFKGKTPAEVLLEDPEKNKKALMTQYEYLKKNLEKYPGNKIQMDAIRDASDLLKKGELFNKKTETQRPSITIYNAEARALIRKAREDGMCPVYTLSIRWNVGEKSPIVVDISNFYAPVTKFEDGRINPQISKKDPNSVVNLTYAMFGWEWMDIIRSIKSNMQQFEMLHAKECFANAQSAARKLRETANQATL